MVDMNEFWLLTNKFLGGEISEQENKRLSGMLETHPLLREQFEEARSMWQESGETEGGADRLLLMRTHEKIRAYEAGELDAPELPPYEVYAEAPIHTIPAQRSRSRTRSWKKWMAAAAVLTGISLFANWFFRQSAHAPVQWATIDVPAGQQKMILLPDSSIVYINAGSHLEYPLTFTDSIREIHLMGEAFFEVTKNTGQPFIVQSGALRTRVLGTSFNIRYYAGEETQSVLVASGKVQVSSNGDLLDLVLPDHLLTWQPVKKSYAVTVQSHEAMNWRQNRMAFNDISFKDLAAELGRRFGKTIVFGDPTLQACRYRAIFKDLPLDQILRQLSLTSGFTYTIKDDSVRVTGKGCE